MLLPCLAQDVSQRALTKASTKAQERSQRSSPEVPRGAPEGLSQRVQKGTCFWTLSGAKTYGFSLVLQQKRKPVLSWNGKRGRCKRSSTRATARNKYARALQQRRRTINTTRGLRATECNLSSIVNKGIGWGVGGGPPRGDPGQDGTAEALVLRELSVALVVATRALRIAADYCG